MSQTHLATRELGRTGLTITHVGIGVRAIGGSDAELRRGPGEEELIATIHRALDAGVNWIDTTARDGLGRSEEIVGRALDGRTDRPFVFTTRALTEAPGRTGSPSLERDFVLGQVEASIRRLQVDAIDLYQLESPDPERDVENVWAALAELKERGMVRHIGVSDLDAARLRRVQRIAPVETLRSPYSLVARDAESEILPFAAREGIGVLACSPMGSGLLTGAMNRTRVTQLADDDWRKRNHRFQEPQLSRHLALLERLRVVAGRHDTTLEAVAIAWTLTNPAVDAAIVGFRRRAEVDPLAAADLDLTQDDLAYLDDTAPCQAPKSWRGGGWSRRVWGRSRRVTSCTAR